MNQDVNERTLMRQEQIEQSTISVREVLAYLDRDRYLNLTQASEYLAISKQTIRSRLDEIPHFRVGSKMLLFKKTEIDTWIEKYREGGDADLDKVIEEAVAGVLA